MDKKKILITGASGFMGSHITDALTNTGKYQVYAVDDHSGGNVKNVPQRCFFYELDLRDRRKTKNLIDRIQPDYVYALAANAREGASFFQPLSVMERNMNVYMNVLEPAIKCGLEKMIYFSSMAVYGEQDPPFKESYERKPCDIYALCKTWCEKTTELLAQAHGFKYVIIRPHNVFGERQSLRDVYRNVIAIFMNRIMRNEPIYIYGDGLQKRAFSYIEASLPCYLKCLDKDISGEVINIGGLNEVTINEMLDTVVACFPEYDKPEVIYLNARHGEVKYAWCEHNKSVDKLGYKEDLLLEESIRKMSEWAKKEGPQEWVEEELPLINEKVPFTWTMPRNQKEENGSD